MKRCRRKTAIICFALFLIVILCVIFYLLHPTYYKFNDSWIVGRHTSDIQERYGEFDLTTDVYVAYYIYTDNKGFLPDHLKHYYYMYYDNDGIVYKVLDACQPGG